ncbi:MAG: tRNA guanosine(34) transglycosylase Tgt [Myxococcales bacterium]|nr:tRNA guanosine(34) transglycosylase Tgt [Myxococcales bacterium]
MVARAAGPARCGVLHTRRGAVETPVFMPVGTAGAVKTLHPDEVRALGYSLVLGNTYHLMLRPGAELVAALGGLHRFMGWDGAILTDSGGYQVFSLQKIRRIHEDGVEFRSHIDGGAHFLSPERAVEIQRLLGADIMMALDECPPHDADAAYHAASCQRTTRWATRCLSARGQHGGALFGIVQGGLDLPLRRAHLDELAAMPFDGLALGGLSVGEGPERMAEVVADVAPRMPPERPRYLMGVGEPRDILMAVSAGIDMFDCVLPTRNARNGSLFTRRGRIQIRNSVHARADRPIEEGCACPACRRFSRAYLRHLYLSNEILGHRLNTLHNLHFFAEFMRDVRRAIREDRLAAFAAEFLSEFEPPVSDRREA